MACGALSTLLATLAALSTPLTRADILATLEPLCVRYAPLVCERLATVATGISVTAAALSTAGKNTRLEASERLQALVHVAAVVWPCAARHACRSLTRSAVGGEELDAVTAGTLGVLSALAETFLGLTPALSGLKAVACAACDLGKLLQQTLELSQGLEMLKVGLLHESSLVISLSYPLPVLVLCEFECITHRCILSGARAD